MKKLSKLGKTLSSVELKKVTGGYYTTGTVGIGGACYISLDGHISAYQCASGKCVGGASNYPGYWGTCQY